MKSKKLIIVISIIGIVIGLVLISYSTVAVFISNISQTYVVRNYDKKISKLPKAEINKIKNKSRHPGKQSSTVFAQGEIEGYITIPKINVLLPIYEGTRETVLNKGAGHLSSTSLPVGGKNTNCVLTGHSGYPTATLFNDLDLLNKGDAFHIKFLDEVHTYKVKKIMVKEKTIAYKFIGIERGKDLCTLITCTPKTINTHRLIVVGQRVKRKLSDKQLNNYINAKEKNQNIIVLILIVSLLVLIILFFCFYKRCKKRGGENGN